MMNKEILLIIFGMFAVTFPFRFVPLLIFNRVSVPKKLKVWLSYVPIAIFSALVVQCSVNGSEDFDLVQKLPLIVSILIAFLLTLRVKSVGWGISVGFAIFMGLTALTSL